VTVRGNRRLLTYALLALVLLVAAAPAQAGRKWCQRDPVFSVNGTLVNVFVSVYDDQQTRVTGPVAVTLSVPPGTVAELISVDEGFNGFGETVTIVTNPRLKVTSRGVQTQIQVGVPSDISMPVLVTVAPESGKAVSQTGRTNTTITVNTSIVASQ
jgi:hypothetical protein